MSRWGNKIKLEIFGSSHGEEIGVVIEGLPKDYKVDMEKVQEQLDRRAPGKTRRTSRRKEDDIPIIQCGLTSDNITNGQVLKMSIKNQNANRDNYIDIKDTPRPGHADYTAKVKFGDDYDNSGGSVFSGRMTAPIVFAGEICRQILETKGIKVVGHISEIFGIKDTPLDKTPITPELLNELKSSAFPIIDKNVESLMIRATEAAMMDLDSVGGIVECGLFGVKAGYGGELFDGLESKFANFMFAIPGVKGVEFGTGFKASKLRGSQNNDAFQYAGKNVITTTNNCGGILGGISDGMPILFRVAFKPTSSIGKEQKTINLKTKQNTTITIKGKHDPCIAPRAVGVVEAAAAIVMLDTILSEE